MRSVNPTFRGILALAIALGLLAASGQAAASPPSAEGKALLERADESYAQKQYARALSLYSRVVDEAPGSARAWAGRGQCLKALGKDDLALLNLDKALELSPRDPGLLVQRAGLLGDVCRFEQALADYVKAVELDSENVAAYNGWAWLMATCPDQRIRLGKKAVSVARIAVDLKKTPYTLDTLAAAFAEAGRFRDAVNTQRLAITLAGGKAPRGFQSRLKLYKKGFAFRDHYFSCPRFETGQDKNHKDDLLENKLPKNWKPF